MTKASPLICIDANIPLRIVIGGPGQEAAQHQWRAWVQAGVRFIAPPLFSFEVTSVIWSHVFFKKFSDEAGQKALETIFEFGVSIEYPPELHHHSWDVARRFHRPKAYDAHYVALAEIFGCEFWTMDKKLYNAVHPHLPFVKTIAE